MAKVRPLVERFWEKVEVRRREDECWEWHGAKARGYGQIVKAGRGGKLLRAHRVSWELEHGPIPDGLIVRHRCDNRGCVNPSHLELGTRKDNNHDMSVRDRGIKSAKGLPYGVQRHGNKWKARIKRACTYRYLGLFATMEEAARMADYERLAT